MRTNLLKVASIKRIIQKIIQDDFISNYPHFLQLKNKQNLSFSRCFACFFRRLRILQY